jgi:hypothetical protein
MSLLIIDVVTTAPEVTTLSAVQHDTLFSWIFERTVDEVERERLCKRVMMRLPQHPLVATIQTVSIYDVKTNERACYVVSDGTSGVVDGVMIKYMTECEMLKEFWQGVLHYDTFISFDGRRISAPFLIHRSRVYGIRQSKALMEGRYPRQQHTCRHIDLLEELCFYGVWSQPRDLVHWARTLGVNMESPPSVDDHLAYALFRQSLIYTVWQKIFPTVIPD